MRRIAPRQASSEGPCGSAERSPAQAAGAKMLLLSRLKSTCLDHQKTKKWEKSGEIEPKLLENWELNQSKSGFEQQKNTDVTAKNGDL
jgi:hypothetical protein